MNATENNVKQSNTLILHGPGGRLTINKITSALDFFKSRLVFIFIFYFYTVFLFSEAKFLSRAGLTLHEVQCCLDREGASDLVIELVVNSVTSPSIFEEAVTLGIALLEGGNPIIQKSCYRKLVAGDLSHAFFKVLISKYRKLILCFGRNCL